MLFRSCEYLPIYFIKQNFGENYVAYYGFCLLLIGKPIGIISYSFSQIFYKRFTENKVVGSYIIKIFGISFALAFIIITFFAIFKNNLSSTFNNWVNSFTIFIPVLIMFLFRFISSCLSSSIYVAGKQKSFFLNELLKLLILFFPLYIFSGNITFVNLVNIYCATSCFVFTLRTFYYLKLINDKRLLFIRN